MQMLGVQGPLDTHKMVILQPAEAILHSNLRMDIHVIKFEDYLKKITKSKIKEHYLESCPAATSTPR